MGYLCANFSLPMPLCSRLRPDVRDRQIDVRQTSDAHRRLMPPTLGAGYNKYCAALFLKQAVREAAQYAPAPVRRTLQPSSSPYTPYACGAKRALFHENS